ncbi:MAG TPA: hypothetical protein VF520_12520 [Thermoleophilaceae bacterium]|jgi:hypothetical protein
MDPLSATVETETSLLDEETEAALTDLAQRVDDAQRALRDVLRAGSDRTWTIRELQDEAANGHSSSVMSIAFLRLLHGGELVVDKGQRVHSASLS